MAQPRKRLILRGSCPHSRLGHTSDIHSHSYSNVGFSHPAANITEMCCWDGLHLQFFLCGRNNNIKFNIFTFNRKLIYHQLHIFYLTTLYFQYFLTFYKLKLCVNRNMCKGTSVKYDHQLINYFYGIKLLINWIYDFIFEKYSNWDILLKFSHLSIRRILLRYYSNYSGLWDILWHLLTMRYIMRYIMASSDYEIYCEIYILWHRLTHARLQDPFVHSHCWNTIGALRELPAFCVCT